MKIFTKIVFPLLAFFFVLAMAATYLDETAFGISAFVIFVVFAYWVNSFINRSKLVKKYNYSKEQVQNMSNWEVQLREEISRADPGTDYRAIPYKDLKKIFKEKTLSLEDYISLAEQGYSEGLGTPGKRIVCLNCGARMSKVLGMWSDSSQCINLGKKCVPHNATF